MTDSESRNTEPADGTADSERNRLDVGTAVLLVIVQLVVFGFLTFVSQAVQLLDPLNLAPTSGTAPTLVGLATVWAVASWVLWAARKNLIAALVSIAPLVVVFFPLAGIFSLGGSSMGDLSAEQGAYVVTETYDSGKKKVVEEWRDGDLVRRHHYWETGKRQSVETYERRLRSRRSAASGGTRGLQRWNAAGGEAARKLTHRGKSSPGSTGSWLPNNLRRAR
jgi:hypothetical protein